MEKNDSIRTFKELQFPILNALETMTGWIDKDTPTKTTQLLLSLRDTTFNVSLMVIDEIFKHTYMLCKALQRDNIDLLEAVNLAKQLTKEVEKIRQNIVDIISMMFKNLIEKSEQLGFDIRIPRICKHQKNRLTYLVIFQKNILEYYKLY